MPNSPVFERGHNNGKEEDSKARCKTIISRYEKMNEVGRGPREGRAGTDKKAKEISWKEVSKSRAKADQENLAPLSEDMCKRHQQQSWEEKRKGRRIEKKKQPLDTPVR